MLVIRQNTLCCGLVALLTAAALAPQTPGADLDPQEVNATIDRAIAYLRRTQLRDGNWRTFSGYEGGTTAVCVLALLTAGVSPDDNTVQRGLAALAPLPPQTTYVTSLQTLCFCAASPRQFAPQIVMNVRWLEATQFKRGPMFGCWGYPIGSGDHSNSQFAMLALYEAARLGVPVESKIWKAAIEHWRQSQNDDGSWGYHPGDPGTGTMTTAGITSLIMAEYQLGEADARVTQGQLDCCGPQHRDPAIERGIAWLTEHFTVRANPGGASAGRLLYYLYGLERVGRLTARRFFGDHDWYREGTQLLVQTQDRLNGTWHSEVSDELSTSFGLLFLAKGRRPILIAKIKHNVDDWDHHRDDAFNLTSFVEKLWKRDLCWQVIDTDDATVDDMLQSPVLYLNGSEAPDLSDEEVKHLREYVDRGGFLFAVASCGGHDFDTGFRQLAKRMFPEPGYELKLLPPEHPVWHAELPVPPNQVHPLYGINSGCRTSVIYCPDDLSCLWELARPRGAAKLDKEIEAQLEGGLVIGANVLAYATNRQVKYKYETPSAGSGQQQEDPFQRAKLYIAKLKHLGDWDSAPRALINAEEALARETGLRVSVDRRAVSMADDKVFNYAIVFMDGRNHFQLSPQEREHLRRYVERGGVLMADSLCASKAFGDSFRQEIAATFAPLKIEPIPASHPLFTAQFGGFDIRRVRFRDPTRAAAGAPPGAEIREISPRLEGIKIGNDYGVIFSPYDLSCALDREDSASCEGYVRQDAAKIAINIVLYALND